MAETPIPVAAGCIVNAVGEVLICQRPPGKIAAGKWEFPGGKIETGESPEQALVRELREELGISVTRARPLLQVQHAYRDRTVLLHAWRVEHYEGTPAGHDGQALAWVHPARLPDWDLLAADWPIVKALLLPAHYVFTPPALTLTALLAGLDHLPSGALLRLRQPALNDQDYAKLAERLLLPCQQRGLRLITDRSPIAARTLGADGWHATAACLGRLTTAPALPGLLQAASVHDERELQRAGTLGFDCTVLGPVLRTPSHPEAQGLGWRGFAALAYPAGLPVYAIGGLRATDVAAAWKHGGQGIAGISGFWPPR